MNEEYTRDFKDLEYGIALYVLGTNARGIEGSPKETLSWATFQDGIRLESGHRFERLDDVRYLNGIRQYIWKLADSHGVKPTEVPIITSDTVDLGFKPRKLTELELRTVLANI